MSRVELSGSWKTTKSQEEVDAIVRRFAAENKMKIAETEESGVINLRGGSQVGMRALGGWFVKPTMLPKRATVKVAETADGTSVDARIEDAMGVGIMDRKLKGKYQGYCEAWIAGLGKELEG